MKLGRTRAVALSGLEGALVDVEADIAPGLPAFLISGLPDAACRQSADRVKAAIVNSGLGLPRERITVNLSPASLPKVGSAFDVGIAVGVLAAAGGLRREVVEDVVHIGELGLDGTVRPVHGVLPLVAAAVRAGHERVAVPAVNAAEAALVTGAQVVPVRHLRGIVERHEAVAAGEWVEDEPIERAVGVEEDPGHDLADIAGQPEARLALEIAAAGGHHMFLLGPPGAGKTMLAEALPTLLPPLDDDAALEVTTVQSVLGVLATGALVRRPPFVAPHHGASQAAIIGGGNGPRPGLVSHAHRGVLFLDESGDGKYTS